MTLNDYAYVIHNVDAGRQAMIPGHTSLDAARAALRLELEKCAAIDDEGVYEIFELKTLRPSDVFDFDSMFDDIRRSMAVRDECERTADQLVVGPDDLSAEARFAWAAGKLIDVLFDSIGFESFAGVIVASHRGHWEVQNAGERPPPDLLVQIEKRYVAGDRSRFKPETTPTIIRAARLFDEVLIPGCAR